MDGVRIFSWNVASWDTALTRVRKQHGSLGAWMEGHHIDILCLQETKAFSSNIEQDPAKYAAREPGYESVWGCNAGSATAKKGFNGVATFCRSGMLLSASSTALQDSAVDADGRCIMTDHGSFIIFNVYAPNTSTPGSLPYKLSFLRLLHSAMNRARTLKPVLLVGDLNLAPHKPDRHWRLLRCNAEKVFDVFEHNAIIDKSKEFPESLTAAVMQQMELLEISVEEIASQNEAGEKVIVKEKNRICVESVMQILKALRLYSALGAPKEDRLRDIAIETGESTTPQPVAQWYHNVLAGEGGGKMIDSFDHLRTEIVPGNPLLVDRFTCWEQRTNKRYENCGSRIDYILVDEPFFVKHCLAPLQRATTLSALHANVEEDCTAEGGFEPAPVDGTGIPDGTAAAFAHQFSYLESPLVYTPPTYSDHIAVSLWLEKREELFPKVLKMDKSCAKCQPQTKQPSISAFFKPKNATQNDRKRPAQAERTQQPAKKRKEDIEVIDLC